MTKGFRTGTPGMHKVLARVLTTILVIFSVPSFAGTRISLQTSEGLIVIELYDKKAPISTKNFLKYVRSGFYDGTLFHRVISNFMIQGGGYQKNYKLKKTHPAIINEAKNGIKNRRGTIAMARTQEANSATSQFFINVADNAFLDKSKKNEGYAVFGQVIQGLSIVDTISSQPTRTFRGLANTPEEPIVLIDAWIEGEEADTKQFSKVPKAA